jgi:hypothetical protein
MVILIPYLALAFVISAILSAVSLQIGTALLCALLGEEKCVTTDGLNGCNWWPLSVLTSTGICYLLWSAYGWHGLTGTIVGPLLSILFAAMYLRFGHRQFREKEFDLTRDGVVDRRSGKLLRPEYIIARSSYESTGPASGYCLHSIVLKNSEGVLAANGYVSELGYERDRHRLIFEKGLPTLSVCFFCETEGEFKSVTLGEEWNDLIFPSDSQIPPKYRVWWKQFAAPRLGEKDVVGVNPDLLRKGILGIKRGLEQAGIDLGAMEPEYVFGPGGEGSYERVRSDISGLERLISISAGRLKALNHEYLSDHVRQIWGKDYPTENRIEEDVWVTVPYRG